MISFSGIMIGSENPKALGEFYAKILGEPGFQQDDWYGFGEQGKYVMIGGHSEVKGKSTAPARIMITLETEDVKGEFDRIKGFGAEVVAEPYMPDEKQADMWLATLADPDGNYIQLAAPWKE